MLRPLVEASEPCPLGHIYAPRFLLPLRSSLSPKKKLAQHVDQTFPLPTDIGTSQLAERDTRRPLSAGPVSTVHSQIIVRANMVRSRGGCSNCKRRKRKCDETRPDCRACQRRGIQCEGYNTTLKWTNGIASRGRFAGAAIPDVSFYSSSSEPSKLSHSDHLPSTEDPHLQVASAPSTSSSTSPPGAEGITQTGSASESGVVSPLARSPGANIDPKRQLFNKCKSSFPSCLDPRYDPRLTCVPSPECRFASPVYDRKLHLAPVTLPGNGRKEPGLFCRLHCHPSVYG